MMLLGILERALLSAGLARQGDCGAIGELNDSVFTIIANDRTAAIEIVKRELEALGILPACQIAVHEGLGWRCVHPSAAINMDWLFDDQCRRLATKQFRAALADWPRHLADYLELKGPKNSEDN
jgi:hypothetical protein